MKRFAQKDEVSILHSNHQIITFKDELSCHPPHLRFHFQDIYLDHVVLEISLGLSLPVTTRRFELGTSNMQFSHLIP